MKKRTKLYQTLPCTLLMVLLTYFVTSADGFSKDRVTVIKDAELTLENKFLKRRVGVVSGVLRTIDLHNKVADKRLLPTNVDEFVMRLSKDAAKPTKDSYLKSTDFNVISFKGTANEIIAELENKQFKMNVKIHYTLNPDKFYGHKFLEITSGDRYIIELLDIEAISFEDAYQPYKAKDMMWTSTKFLPALGQPLYTTESASFWGVEFPASWNRVEDKTIHCGYQAAIELQPNQKYTSYKAVFGVGDDPKFIKDAFLDYIDQIRAVPFGLHVQYNSWFDFGGSISQQKFLESLDKLHKELVEKRGCKPLDIYVVDDAWQNSRPPRSPLDDWSTGMYKVNEKLFDPEMKTVREEIEKRGSKMGLWASPACLFGATANLDVLQEKGFETLVGKSNAKSGKVNKSMSMTGEKYMTLLEEALLRMVKMGAVYFKFDGIFGHLGTRFFEVVPGRGTPVMTDLLPEGITADDPRLNDPKFDEMKRYYITRGTERLISIYQKMRAANPEIRILNHNGTTISPWWFMTIDVLSLVNEQDGAQGTSRNEQMCYRDAIYYQTTVTDNNQIPLNSVFNHEPAKDGKRFGDADKQSFQNYFFMAISRGTAMVELYIQTKTLLPHDYDVIADGLKWLYKINPAFKRSRMHGGNPLGTHTFNESNVALKDTKIDAEANVYGYTGWTKNLGYVSIHNPRATQETYTFKLDRSFGVEPGSGPFKLSSPMAGKIKGLKSDWKYGDTFSLEISPKDVVILDFEAIGTKSVKK